MQNEEGRGSDNSRSPRFTHWIALFVFSTITLGSAVGAANNNDQTDAKTKQNEKWSIACSSITFALCAIVILMHFNAVTSLFIVGTKLEGCLCVLLAAFWAGTVAVVADARHGLAVNEMGAVSNGNLYYFSWAGFICSVTLLTSYLRSAFQIDVAGEIRSRSARLTTWSAHMACSLIVMGASANIFQNDCIEADVGYVFCRRTKLGIGLGAVGTVLALIIVAMKIATSKSPFLVEATFSFILVVSFAFGVAYITSEQGPGSPLGNLYYFTWGAFLSSFMLIASCYEDYNAAKNITSSTTEGDTEAEVEVEDMGDQI
mmetsp:Transcript_37212/g.81494  ORF Transcript_37212/g.81494 Transcript_37212/m.81494 type:complete len:316 (+) Transcript_37212:73-1020(+)